MGFQDDKTKGSNYSVSALSPNDAFGSSTRNSGFATALSDLEKKDSIYKRRIRILRLVSRIGSLILNAYMVGTLSFSLAKYFLTKNKIIAGNQHPWATPTKLWPTFMLLAIAIITFLMNFITICTYMCGIGAANKTSSVASIVGYVMLAVHVVIWAVAAGAFKMASNGKDLWGWSCSTNADAIANEVKSFMDFGMLCTLQTGAWWTSVIEAVVYGATFFVAILIVRRASHKKKLKSAKSNFEMDPTYQNELESGTTYKPNVGRNYLPVAVESPRV